jgi:hypothetical protein
MVQFISVLKVESQQAGDSNIPRTDSKSKGNPPAIFETSFENGPITHDA